MSVLRDKPKEISPKAKVKLVKNRKRNNHRLSRLEVLEKKMLYRDDELECMQIKVKGSKEKDVRYWLYLAINKEGFSDEYVSLQLGKYKGRDYDEILNTGKRYFYAKASSLLEMLFDDRFSDVIKSTIYLSRFVVKLHNPNQSLEGLHVHHLDGNPLNNAIENLIMLPRKSHQVLHIMQNNWMVQICQKPFLESVFEYKPIERDDIVLILFYDRESNELCTKQKQEKISNRKSYVIQKGAYRGMKITKKNILALLEEFELIEYISGLRADCISLEDNYDKQLAAYIGFYGDDIESVSKVIRARQSEATRELGYRRGRRKKAGDNIQREKKNYFTVEKVVKEMKKQSNKKKGQLMIDVF